MNDAIKQPAASVLVKPNSTSPIALQNANAPSLPAGYVADYMAATSTPSVQERPGAYQAITGAFKDAGGGWKGAGMAALTGLGRLGEFVSTKTGQQLLSGTTNDPYMKMAYLEGAQGAQTIEQAKAQRAFEEKQARTKEQGEMIRSANQQQTEKDKALLEAQMEAQRHKDEMDAKAREDAMRKEQVDKDIAEFQRKPVEEQRKAIIDSAQAAFTKGQISASDLNEITRNPDTKQVVDRGWLAHLVPFMKTSKVIDKPTGTTKTGATWTLK